MKSLEKIIFQNYKEVLNWLQIDYEKHCETYLSLDDYDEPPYRNILVCGVGRTVEQARATAIENLKKELIKVSPSNPKGFFNYRGKLVQQGLN